MKLIRLGFRMKECYDLLDEGIIIVNRKSTMLYVNSWLLQQLPKETRESSHLDDLLSKKNAHYINSRLQQTFENLNPTILTPIFHKHIIPLTDKKFDDNLMRQYGIMTPVLIEKPGINERELCLLFQIKNVSNMALQVLELEKALKERNKAEAELKKMQQKAEAANQAKSDFLASMSHEIRTPMNSILGFTEILKERIQAPEHQEHLNAIQSSGQSLLALINDILDLSKVESGKMELEYGVVDVATVFQHVKPLFSQAMKNKGLSFRIDFDSSLHVPLILDEIRLRQLLTNLISNAIRFTSSGSITLSAKLRFSPKHYNIFDLVCSVEDTGIGIPENQIERIFEDFKQVKGQNYELYGGTGLGLSICKRIVERMGGHIYVQSFVGKGSIFTFVIKDVEVALSGDKQPRTEAAKESLVFAPATLLIADDVALNRKLLKDYLHNSEFKIIEAANGQEALDKAREHKPDVVLMDVRMPVMDGLEAMQAMKKDSRLQHIPIIAITASAMIGAQKEVKKISDVFLSKPVSKKGIITALSRFLEYRVREASLSTHIAPEPIQEEEKIVEDWQPDALTLKHLPRFLEQYEYQTQQNWELRDELSIGEIEEWGKKTFELAENYNYLPLSRWGEAVRLRAQSMDIEALENNIEHFPQLMKQLKQYVTQQITRQ